MEYSNVSPFCLNRYINTSNLTIHTLLVDIGVVRGPNLGQQMNKLGRLSNTTILAKRIWFGYFVLVVGFNRLFVMFYYYFLNNIIEINFIPHSIKLSSR